jgi:GlpG protein
MRPVASFDDERAAKRFADVLCARDIDTELSRGKDGDFVVWVLDERDLEACRAVWAAFDAHPDAPEYAATEGCVDRKQHREAREQRKSRHSVIDVRQSLWRSGSTRPTLTLTLVGISIAVSLASGLGKRDTLLDWLFIGTPEEAVQHRLFASVLSGQVWRLVTPIFIHFGILHIVFNMWWMVDIGSALERRLGWRRFGAVVLVSAVVSNVAQYVWTGNPFFGGMSGVLYALFAYIFARSRIDSSLGFTLAPATVIILLGWMLLGFTDTVGNTANQAHLSGLIVGAILGLVAGRRAR